MTRTMTAGPLAALHRRGQIADHQARAGVRLAQFCEARERLGEARYSKLPPSFYKLETLIDRSFEFHCPVSDFQLTALKELARARDDLGDERMDVAVAVCWRGETTGRRRNGEKRWRLFNEALEHLAELWGFQTIGAER